MSRKAMIDIAIVDDNAIIRYSVRYLMSSNGLSVAFEAENGKVCLEKMSQTLPVPDVIILDLEMPVMDGFETAVALKENWPDTHIVAFSGRDDMESRDRSLNAGADHFVSKHGDPFQLVSLIREICTELA